MRKLLLLPIAAALFLPSLAGAEWDAADRAARRPARPPQAQPAPAPARPAPGAPAILAPDGRTRLLAPAPPRGPGVRQPPRVGYYGYGPYAYDAVPFWLGWGWGWGYYPLWPRPYYPGEEPGYVPDDARRIAARLEAYGAGANHGAAGTLAMALEGPIGGFNADVTGLSVSPATGTGSGDAVLTLGGARATWSVLSDAAFRLRLELGATMVSVPATGPWVGASYANSMAFGPQVGVSGHLGLIGPLGVEGHARVTPYPFPVFDARAAFVLRGGPLALSAGWRAIDVNGDRIDSPEAHFAGPELGLQLVF